MINFFTASNYKKEFNININFIAFVLFKKNY